MQDLVVHDSLKALLLLLGRYLLAYFFCLVVCLKLECLIRTEQSNELQFSKHVVLFFSFFLMSTGVVYKRKTDVEMIDFLPSQLCRLYQSDHTCK